MCYFAMTGVDFLYFDMTNGYLYGQYKDKLTFRKSWITPNARHSKGYRSDNNVVNSTKNFGHSYDLLLGNTLRKKFLIL